MPPSFSPVSSAPALASASAPLFARRGLLLAGAAGCSTPWPLVQPEAVARDAAVQRFLQLVALDRVAVFIDADRGITRRVQFRL